MTPSHLHCISQNCSTGASSTQLSFQQPLTWKTSTYAVLYKVSPPTSRRSIEAGFEWKIHNLTQMHSMLRLRRLVKRLATRVIDQNPSMVKIAWEAHQTAAPNCVQTKLVNVWTSSKPSRLALLLCYLVRKLRWKCVVIHHKLKPNCTLHNLPYSVTIRSQPQHEEALIASNQTRILKELRWHSLQLMPSRMLHIEDIHLAPGLYPVHEVHTVPAPNHGGSAEMHIAVRDSSWSPLVWRRLVDCDAPNRAATGSNIHGQDLVGVRPAVILHPKMVHRLLWMLRKVPPHSSDGIADVEMVCRCELSPSEPVADKAFWGRDDFEVRIWQLPGKLQNRESVPLVRTDVVGQEAPLARGREKPRLLPWRDVLVQRPERADSEDVAAPFSTNFAHSQQILHRKKRQDALYNVFGCPAPYRIFHSRWRAI